MDPGRQRGRVTAAAPQLPAPAGPDAIFAPIPTANAFEQTVERIGRAIQLGLLEPGERLPPERALAARLGLSRTTVREALGLLTEAGYLESRRGRGGGTFVAAVPPKPVQRDPVELGPQLLETLRVRRALELGVADLAAEHATPGDCERLGALVAACGEHDASNYPAYRAADCQVHVGLAVVTGSPRLVEAMTDVQATLSEVLSGIPRSDVVLENSNAQHRRLLDAVAAHDRRSATDVMREHVEGVERLLAGLLLLPG